MQTSNSKQWKKKMICGGNIVCVFHALFRTFPNSNYLFFSTIQQQNKKTQGAK